MKFKESSVTSQKEILKVKTGAEYTDEIKLDDSAFTNGVCKAGNPISSEGKKVNGGGSDAAPIGILLEDVYDENPNGTLVIAFGVINEANANANASITIAAGVKTALNKLVFA